VSSIIQIGVFEDDRRRVSAEFHRRTLHVSAGVRALARGLMVRRRGDAVTLCRPLIVTEPRIVDMIGRVKLTLDDTLAWLENGRPRL
jgi:adenosylmethionine-8-amino-7-oxononanoate aminotransferase